MKDGLFLVSLEINIILVSLDSPETAAIRPMYPYALTKYLGEQYAMHWDQVSGMPCVSLRFFNVYGPALNL